MTVSNTKRGGGRKAVCWSAGLVLLTALLAGFGLRRALPDTGWLEYNGDGARSHYSPLKQINKKNVKRLQVAWVYASGGADTLRNRSQMQCNPIVVDGVLYGVSANTQAFALEAATGRQIWKTSLPDNGGTTSRGVTYWQQGNDKRILFGAGKWLYALDAATGKALPGFGQQGRIDLTAGITRPGSDDHIRVNTPVTTYQNLAIVGARLAESETALLGDIRAFDVRSGQLVWTFRTIPAEGDYGYQTWSPGQPRRRLGGANAWAGMAIDRQRGIVYAPTGSPAFDFFGGNRKGDNLFGNCLLALDAATGRRLWHFQFVHHDIWDRDPPGPPNLLTLTHRGRQVDAVAQTTKQGHVFVFDRVTGQPLFPIHERPFPGDAVAGEQPSPTQPIPALPAPFTRQAFTEKDINPFSADRAAIAARLRQARTGSAYLPLTEKMTLFFPGTDGGAQWGGSAADPQGTIYVPAKENPVYSSLVPRPAPAPGQALSGAQLYRQHCGACHGQDRGGSHDGAYPALLQLAGRLPEAEVRRVLLQGRGRMPSFSHLPEKESQALLDFLLDRKSALQVAAGPGPAVPYQHTGYNRWYDSAGYPVSAPPWGTLTAIDLNTGRHRWQVPLGEYPELSARGIPPTGTDNYGGPLVTASGLIFIAATRDERLRAFDKETGQLLWQTQLPAAGYASPSTYAIGGRQFVVIACGGGKLNTRSGDKYLAFALD